MFFVKKCIFFLLEGKKKDKNTVMGGSDNCRLTVHEACRTMGFTHPPDSLRTLRQKFLLLAKTHHPDNPHTGNMSSMVQLTEAYQFLRSALNHRVGCYSSSSRSSSSSASYSKSEKRRKGDHNRDNEEGSTVRWERDTVAAEMNVPSVGGSEVWLPWQKKAPHTCSSLSNAALHKTILDRVFQDHPDEMARFYSTSSSRSAQKKRRCGSTLGEDEVNKEDIKEVSSSSPIVSEVEEYLLMQCVTVGSYVSRTRHLHQIRYDEEQKNSSFNGNRHHDRLQFFRIWSDKRNDHDRNKQEKNMEGGSQSRSQEEDGKFNMEVLYRSKFLQAMWSEMQGAASFVGAGVIHSVKVSPVVLATRYAIRRWPGKVVASFKHIVAPPG